MRRKIIEAGIVAVCLLGIGGMTASGQGNNIPSVCGQFAEGMTPSTGKVNLMVFAVSFPDMEFEGETLSDKELEQALFDGSREGSMTTFEKTSSYGALQVEGQVRYYEAQLDNAYYQSLENGYEALAEEVLSYFDDEIDYTECDSDGNGYIDAFTLNIAGQDNYWYGCQATWWEDTDFSVDGVKPYNYIINDAQPYQENMEYYVSEMCHEFGHCMGLPDLYLYDTDDYEGMKGIAGTEMMEDMTGDYSMFSKLMLGWLQQKQVKIYGGGSRNYRLASAEKTGGCIVIPRTTGDNTFTGEYFLIQYDTPDGNLKNVLTDEDAGVRIFHIDAEVASDEYSETSFFRYNGFSEYYDKSHEGIRIIRLVNDESGYFKAGDTVDAGSLLWYDEDGKETVDSGITIQIKNSSAKNKIQIEISRK